MTTKDNLYVTRPYGCERFLATEKCPFIFYSKLIPVLLIYKVLTSKHTEVTDFFSKSHIQSIGNEKKDVGKIGKCPNALFKWSSQFTQTLIPPRVERRDENLG